MPRYCAATCCRNRAGLSPRDQRRLSFYPFPLHDKARLEKWLQNMKRDSWTPSKHQVLCSDHFTPDSLDVRWGIRYVKATAVPTIFSLHDNQEKDLNQKKTQDKRTEEAKESCISDTASLKPCSPKRNSVIEENLYEKEFCRALRSTSPRKKTLFQPTVKPEPAYPNDSMKQNFEETSPVVIAADVQHTAARDCNSPENSSFNSSAENIFSSTTTILQATINDLQPCLGSVSNSEVTVLQATDLEHLVSSAERSDAALPTNDLSDQLNAHVADCSVEVQQTSDNTVLLHTVSQALETFDGNKDSAIAIIVPFENSKTPLLFEGSVIPAKWEVIDTEDEKSTYISNYSGIEELLNEHSYCRQYINRDQVWQKINKLHTKIELLEIQERKTLSRLKSLEVLITKLKQENLLSEEKLKIVEDSFTAFEVTMIQ